MKPTRGAVVVLDKSFDGNDALFVFLDYQRRKGQIEIFDRRVASSVESGGGDLQFFVRFCKKHIAGRHLHAARRRLGINKIARDPHLGFPPGDRFVDGMFDGPTPNDDSQHQENPCPGHEGELGTDTREDRRAFHDDTPLA
ncbi:hypothetical protein [Sinorhizobium fredii]|uniref:hypothetical protein n=1 Tax=Rhizobium fredii TaxID=380 RepID=UPI001FCB566F|nr:hypothetical protein [Sinorhizobium fredii]